MSAGATYSAAPGSVLRLFPFGYRCALAIAAQVAVGNAPIVNANDRQRPQLHPGAIEIMMDGLPMHLHPNGLAVASYRHQQSSSEVSL
jgi:hypothetical protein